MWSERNIKPDGQVARETMMIRIVKLKSQWFDIKLVEVKTSTGKFLRHIQRIFVLEMGKEEYIRDTLSRKQKILAETEKCQGGRDGLSDENIIPQKKVECVTKSERKVQPPIRMNL